MKCNETASTLEHVISISIKEHRGADKAEKRIYEPKRGDLKVIVNKSGKRP